MSTSHSDEAAVVIHRVGPREVIAFGRPEELDLLGTTTQDVPPPFVAAVRRAVAAAPQFQGLADTMSGRVLRLTGDGMRLLRDNESMRTGVLTGVVRNPANGKIAGHLTFVDPRSLVGLAGSLPSLAGGMAMQLQLAQIERSLAEIQKDLGYLIRHEHLKIEAGIETNLEILQSVHEHALRHGVLEDDQWHRVANVEASVRSFHKETKKHLRALDEALESHGQRLAARVARLNRALNDERTLYWLRAHVHAELALARWDAIYLLRQAEQHPEDLAALADDMQAQIRQRQRALASMSQRITRYLMVGGGVDRILDQLRIVRKGRLRSLLGELDDLLRVFPSSILANESPGTEVAIPLGVGSIERGQWDRLVARAHALPVASKPLRERVGQQVRRVPVRRRTPLPEDGANEGGELPILAGMLESPVEEGRGDRASEEEATGMAAGDWEQYEGRYSERPETYDAYVDVWIRSSEASSTFSGWASFSQAANAEPKQRSAHPDRVEAAERIMRSSGYKIGTPTRRGARRWTRARG